MTKYKLLYAALAQEPPLPFAAGQLLPNWDISTCESLCTLEEILLHEQFIPQVVLVTIDELSQEQITILHKLCKLSETMEWIVVHPPLLSSAEASALERLEDATYAFEERPVAHKKLARILNRAAKASLIASRIQALSHQQGQRFQINTFHGSSPAARRVRAMLERLAKVPVSTLLICGETGTGKGLVARSLHHAGLRRNGPMVELNCAALPHDLLESQLFGHEPGAFTGAKQRHRGLLEQADGGTLFLDEIGDLALPLQAKLLTAIEDKKFRRLGSEQVISVDVQIFAATGQDLTQATAEGTFREDLYHRLSVFFISLPPLRERLSDLPELIPPLIVEFNHKARKKVTQVPENVWQKLMTHTWPGNVRELRNIIERCVLLSSDDTLSAQWLELAGQNPTKQASIQSDPSPLNSEANPEASPDSSTQATTEQTPITDDQLSIPLDGSMGLEEINKMIIEKALEASAFNISHTAKRLGLSRQTLRYRIKKYAISRLGKN